MYGKSKFYSLSIFKLLLGGLIIEVTLYYRHFGNLSMKLRAKEKKKSDLSKVEVSKYIENTCIIICSNALSLHIIHLHV